MPKRAVANSKNTFWNPLMKWTSILGKGAHVIYSYETPDMDDYK